MEPESWLAGENARGYKYAAKVIELEGISAAHSVLADAVLTELKRQAQDGCVLCSLDSLDEGEWD